MPIRSDTETLVAVALMLVTAAVIVYLGYRIRYRGDVRLVAGYDPDDVVDDEGLAALVGGVTIALGVVHGLYGLGLLYFPPTLAFWSGYLLVFLGGIAVVQARGRRYTI
jgi:hypothetical protein